MSNQITRDKIVVSLLWRILERGGTQGIQFLVQIILARVLLPEEYGVIAMVSLFTIIAGVFVQSGLNTALIQKKDADETDFSSVFYLSVIIAGVVYTVLFFIAPVIASFYSEPELIPVLRILSTALFLGAFNSIQNAIIARNMQFKLLFYSSLISTTVSGAIGIAMAYMNFGVWALVAQQIINQFTISFVLWFTVKWRPKLIFSIDRVKGLFSFGWKLLVSSLLDNFYTNARSLIIGKIYNAEMLAYYNRGEQFPSLIISNIDTSIQSVMFPTLAQQQDNKQRVKDMMRRSIITSTFLVFPLMVGLAVIAKPLIIILLTDKWIPSISFLQISCAVYALYPVHQANLQAINALGRSDIVLKLEIIKKIIGVIILVITVLYGVYAIALGVLIVGIICTFLNAYPNLKLLNYSYKEQLMDIMPALGLSIIMGVAAYCVNFLNLFMVLTLVLQVIIGFVVYFFLAYIFKLECFTYLLSVIRDIYKRRMA